MTNGYPTKWSEVAKHPKVLRNFEDRPHFRRTAKRKQWKLVEEFTIPTPWGLCGAYPGMIFDQATGARDLWDAAACTTHDCLCYHHVNFEGVVLTRHQTDMVFRYVNERSWHKWNRRLAAPRYYFVRAYDHRPFKEVRLADPIPPHAYWMYDHLKDTEIE